jgi:hypothetical protein
MILDELERRHGKSIETNREACRYACAATGREMCIDIARMCSASLPVYWIPEVPISCGVLMAGVCAGRVPACVAACMMVKP